MPDAEARHLRRRVRWIAFVHAFVGGFVAVENAISLVNGETFRGKPITNVGSALLGAAGCAAALFLAIGSIGLVRHRLWGRQFTFVALVANIGVAWLTVPAYAGDLGYALNYAVFGSLLPLASLVLLKRPAARKLFHATPVPAQPRSEPAPARIGSVPIQSI